jgi:hypothetical protein
MKRRRKREVAEAEEAPIYLRYQQVQQEREGYQKALKNLYQKQTGTGFKPKINQLSKEMVKRKEESDVVQRLMEKGREIEERKREIVREKQRREQRMREWRASGTHTGTSSSFFDRQKKFIEKKEEKIKELKQNVKEEFKPKINLVSKVLAEELREERGEKSSRWETRLGDYEVRKGILRRQERKVQREKQQGTFRPKINAISRKVAKKKTFKELADVSQKEAKLEKKRREKLAKEMEGCSFKPQINERKGRGGRKKAIEERIKEWEQRKQLKLEVSKQEREEAELRKCQFAPELFHEPGSIPKEVQNQRMLANIRGLGKFLENKEMGFRKQEEKQQAYQEAFGKWGQGYTSDPTVPQPFKLKTANKRARRTELKSETRVFRPVTKNLIYQEVLNKFEEAFD